MKKSVAILILSFMLSAMLMACVPDENADKKDDTPTAGGENTENGGDAPTAEVGTQVGDLLASVRLERLDGGEVSPDDFRGKIVILNIWATWCPPCKAELPDFDKFAADHAEDVVIIAAHDYYGRQDATSYVAENFPEASIIFAYDSATGDAYTAAGGNGYVPFTAVLDRNGVIIYNDSGILSYERLSELVTQADE